MSTVRAPRRDKIACDSQHIWSALLRCQPSRARMLLTPSRPQCVARSAAHGPFSVLGHASRSGSRLSAWLFDAAYMAWWMGGRVAPRRGGPHSCRGAVSGGFCSANAGAVVGVGIAGASRIGVESRRDHLALAMFVHCGQCSAGAPVGAPRPDAPPRRQPREERRHLATGRLSVGPIAAGAMCASRRRR